MQDFPNTTKNLVQAFHNRVCGHIRTGKSEWETGIFVHNSQHITVLNGGKKSRLSHFIGWVDLMKCSRICRVKCKLQVSTLKTLSTYFFFNVLRQISYFDEMDKPCFTRETKANKKLPQCLITNSGSTVSTRKYLSRNVVFAKTLRYHNRISSIPFSTVGFCHYFTKTFWIKHTNYSLLVSMYCKTPPS